MVAKILTGLEITVTQYQIHSRRVWQLCLIFGVLTALIGQGAASGTFLIILAILGLGAYCIDNAQRSKKGRK